ncbi:MAG: nickel ABC transporter permease [Actinobacteria bacterium 69-20]|nr:MAG: nickel ABC transporter permease [Actinobacteria bacterium 69-20]
MRANPTLFAGVIIVCLTIAVAVLAPILAPFDPIDQDLTHALAGPSGSHWLGTDSLGRDVFSRIVWASRIDLAVAFASVVAPFVVGTAVGLVVGYVGGRLDAIVARMADVVVAFPVYVLIIALVFALGPGVASIFIAIAIVSWVPYMRIVRGETRILRSRAFVEAARVGEFSHIRILLRHIAPNVISQPIVYASSDVIRDILAIATLGYLGLGVPPPAPEWGAMIADGQEYFSTDWMLAVGPGVAVVVTGFGLALVGDGLARAWRIDR